MRNSETYRLPILKIKLQGCRRRCELGHQNKLLRIQSNTTLCKVRYFDRSPPVVVLVVISGTRSADRGCGDKPVDRVFTHSYMYTLECMCMHIQICSSNKEPSRSICRLRNNANSVRYCSSRYSQCDLFLMCRLICSECHLHHFRDKEVNFIVF